MLALPYGSCVTVEPLATLSLVHVWLARLPDYRDMKGRGAQRCFKI